MWGETVDGSDIQQTVWPRLGAIAERLWSARTVNSTDLFETRIVSDSVHEMKLLLGANFSCSKSAGQFPLPSECKRYRSCTIRKSTGKVCPAWSWGLFSTVSAEMLANERHANTREQSEYFVLIS